MSTVHTAVIVTNPLNFHPAGGDNATYSIYRILRVCINLLLSLTYVVRLKYNDVIIYYHCHRVRIKICNNNNNIYHYRLTTLGRQDGETTYRILL